MHQGSRLSRRKVLLGGVGTAGVLAGQLAQAEELRLPRPGIADLTARIRSDGWISTAAYGGIASDGRTDVTVPLTRALADVVTEYGAELRLSPGRYRHGPIVVDRRNGGRLSGRGAVILPAATGVTLYTGRNADALSGMTPFVIEGLSVSSDGMANVTFYAEAKGFLTKLINLHLHNLAWNGRFLGGRGITLSDITQYGSGSWALGGNAQSGDTDRIFDIDIRGMIQESRGPANGALAWSAPWFQFYRAVNANIANVTSSSLDGSARGLEIIGDCQGIFASNVIVVYPTDGVFAAKGADGLVPKYVYLSNFAVDQPTRSAYDVEVANFRGQNVLAANGGLRRNTGVGYRIRGQDHQVSGLRVAYMQGDGLVVEAGTRDVTIHGAKLSDNNRGGSPGAYDLRVVNGAPRDVRLRDVNAGTRNIVGQELDESGSTVLPARR